MSDPQPQPDPRPAEPHPADPGTPVEQVDPLMRALARAVDRSGRRLDAVEALVAQLAADLATLARFVRADTTHPTAAAGSPDGLGEGREAGEAGEVASAPGWLLAEDPDQAAVDLEDLCAWLGRVYLRYPRTELPSCWLWHPHAVEELWWLRRAHADAYDPQTGSWLRVGDWHDRQLPGVTGRLAQSIGACELALHVPGERAVGAPRAVPFAADAPSVAQVWTGSLGCQPGPEPSRAQLAQAEAQFHARYRTGR